MHTPSESSARIPSAACRGARYGRWPARFLAGLAAFTLTLAAAGAQTVASIRGSLFVPSTTPRSLATVSVTVIETGQRAAVDARGEYVLSPVAPGTYTLLAAGEGFSRLRLTEVSVTAGEVTEIAPREMPILLERGRLQADAERTESHRETDVLKLDRFVVTDARPQAFTSRNVDLPRGVNDIQPYYIYTGEEMEFSGSLTVEDFLKEKLTMDATDRSNSQTYAAGIGTVGSINLRGLGPDRTLVLINGRRAQGVDQQVSNVYGNQPDLNAIPQGAIERIEVLPSGASAIYGASAIGGVVNVVLKGNYTGGQVRATYQNAFDNDAPTRNLDLLYGVSLEGGRTQIMISGSYRDVAPVYFKDRPEIAIRGINTILQNNPEFFYNATTPPALGSTTNIALNTAVVNGFRNAQNNTLTLKDGRTLNSRITHVPPGVAAGSPVATLANGLLANAGRYNTAVEPGNGIYGLNNQIGATPTVEALSVSVTRQMTPRLELFAEFKYGKNEGVQAYNRISRNATFVVPGNAPTNPFRENVTIHFPTYTDTPLNSKSMNKAVTLGAMAQLPREWRGQMDVSWSQNYKTYDINVDDTEWLNASLADGSLNPFVDTTLHPIDVVPFLAANWYHGTATLKDVSVRSSGPLPEFRGLRPVLSAGAGYREQGYQDTAAHSRFPVTVSRDGDTVYLPQQSETSHAYAELQFPLIRREHGLPFVRTLDFQAATRYEAFAVGTGTPSYTGRPSRVPPTIAYAAPTINGEPFFETTKYDSFNYTTGLKYVPVGGLTVRASYATAFIPPTAAQLLPNPQPSTALTTITDPQTGQRYGVPTQGGGNRDLTPQNTVNWNAGVIWQPAEGGWKGLRLDVNYYYVKERDLIFGLNAETIVNTPELQGRITRDPTTGRITLVDTSLANLSYYETAGWDVSAAYRRTVSFGNLSLSASATVPEYFRRQIGPNDPFLDYVGYPSLRGVPRVKSSGTFAWGRKGLTLGWSSRYISSYGVFDAPGSPYYSGPGVAFTDRISKSQGGHRVDSQLYHDVFGSYVFGKRPRGGGALGRAADVLFRGVTLKAGIRNVLNTAPPFDAYNNPYFYSYYGGARLREYWISVRKDF
jgi:iron complex outermembrane receptor protein